MQFTKKTITIATKDGPEDIEAIVGESSGLAYHKDYEGYSVTAIASGYLVVDTDRFTKLLNDHDSHDESIMQHFIENIANLLDWHQADPQAVIKQGKERYPDHYGVYYELRKAFDKAREQATAEIKQRIAAQEVQA